MYIAVLWCVVDFLHPCELFHSRTPKIFRQARKWSESVVHQFVKRLTHRWWIQHTVRFFNCCCPPEAGFDRIDVCGGWCMWYCTSEIFWNLKYDIYSISSRYLKHVVFLFQVPAIHHIQKIHPTKKRVLKDVPPTWSKHRSGGSSFEGGGGRSFGSAGDSVEIAAPVEGTVGFSYIIYRVLYIIRGG